MPKASDVVDEAILRRRERKRKNTQVWREKERNTLDGLKMQVTELERQLSLSNRKSQAHHDIQTKINQLLNVQKGLNEQNNRLQEALHQQELGILVQSSALGEPRPSGEPQLYDNLFLLNHIQQALHEMSGNYPTTIEVNERKLDMRLVNGWMAKSVQVDQYMYFDISKMLQNVVITSNEADVVSRCHWYLCSQREPYMRLNKQVVEFHVIRRPHNDLNVVRCTLNLGPNIPKVVRYMVLYKIQTDDGYDFCSMSFSPDLSCITGSLMLKYRSIGTLTSSAVAIGRCIIPQAYNQRQTVMVLAAQISQWENLMLQLFQGSRLALHINPSGYQSM